MAGLPATARLDRQNKKVQVAREIAIDHRSTEDILKHYSITDEEWGKLREDPDFVRILEAEIAAWQGAQNTHERTKLKAAAVIEEWLLEANSRLHDGKESLSSRTELAKLIARIAEMGVTNVATAGGSERFSVTINLGNATPTLKFEKEVQPQMIDVSPGEAND